MPQNIPGKILEILTIEKFNAEGGTAIANAVLNEFGLALCEDENTSKPELQGAKFTPMYNAEWYTSIQRDQFPAFHDLVEYIKEHKMDLLIDLEKHKAMRKEHIE